MIVVGELGLEVPEGFGVAPSTATFRAWESESKGSSPDSKSEPASLKL